eukprot:SAG11_NODE_902_length_6620_cov_3.401012_4_plen_140_part_00
MISFHNGRLPEKFFFEPLALDWADTTMEVALHQRVWQAVLGCSIDMRQKLLANTSIVGGNTNFIGLPNMLYKKLRAISSNQTAALKVSAAPPEERAAAAWVGGSVLASLSSFSEQLVLADDYDEDGPNAIHRMNILSLA